jgi:hypothetical protein
MLCQQPTIAPLERAGDPAHPPYPVKVSSNRLATGGRAGHPEQQVTPQSREAARRSLSLHRTQMAQGTPGGRDSVEPP